MPSNAPKHKTLMSFDFGMKRIGIALGQTVTQTANPLTSINAKDGIPNWDEIANLIQEWEVDALVVGIPYNMDGTMQTITFAALKFARRLHNRFHLRVYTVDERLTTVEARRHLQKSTQVDSYAAKLILESWLKQTE